MTTHWIPGIALAVLLATAIPAAAHHSGAMFDQESEVLLNGTVKEFQYTSPHSWIQLVVPGEDGAAVEWSVETAAPIVLLRKGIRPTSLQPGETVSIRAHPLKSGAAGAELIEVTRADGTALGFSQAN